MSFFVFMRFAIGFGGGNSFWAGQSRLRGSGLHRLHRRIEVDAVGRGDENVIQLPVCGRRLVGGDHFIVGTIALDRVRPLGGFFERDFWIREQRAGDDAPGAVKVNGPLMRMDDEGAFAAAHQSDVEKFVAHDLS